MVDVFKVYILLGQMPRGQGLCKIYLNIHRQDCEGDFINPAIAQARNTFEECKRARKTDRLGFSAVCQTQESGQRNKTPAVPRLFSSLSVCHRLESPGEREPQLRDCLHQADL